MQRCRFRYEGKSFPVLKVHHFILSGLLAVAHLEHGVPIVGIAACIQHRMDGICAGLEQILAVLLISAIVTGGLFKAGRRYLCQFQQVLRLVRQFSQVYAGVDLFICCTNWIILLKLLTPPAFPPIAPLRDQEYIVCLLSCDVCWAHRARIVLRVAAYCALEVSIGGVAGRLETAVSVVRLPRR